MRCSGVCRFQLYRIPRKANSQANSVPLNPTAALHTPALKSSLHPWCDPQLGASPEAIHFTGEMGGNLRRADHQQHLVVLMGSTRAPVEAAGDDGLAIDHSELVVDILERGLPAWVLRDAQRG